MSPRRELAGVALAGLALGVLLTAPALLHPGRVMGAPESEVFSGVWVLDWAQRSLLETGLPPAFAPELNYPHGRGLHALPMWEALLTLPLRPFFDPILRYTLSTVLDVAVALVGAWLYLRPHSPRPLDALPGALAFATTPALLGAIDSGPVETLGIGWMALALWAIPRGLAGPLPRTLLAGLLYGASFLANPYWFVFVTLAAAWLNLTAMPRGGWGRALIIGAVAAIVLAPQAWAIQASLSGTSAPWVHTDAELSRHLRTVEHIQDPLSFLLPTDAWYRPGPAWRVYLGLVLLGLALLGLRSPGAWRQGLLLLAAAVYVPGARLSFAGEPVVIGGRYVDLPAELLSEVPVMSSVHHPFRAVPVMVLSLGVLATAGLARRRAALAPVAAAAVLVDQLWIGPSPLPLRSTDVRVPAFYRELGADPEDYAVLDYSSASAQLNFGRPMLYQAWHRKRLLFDVRPPEIEMMRNPLVFLAQWDVGAQGPPAIPADLCSGARGLGGLGVRYVVKHKWDDAPDPRWEAVLRCGLPVARDDAEVTALRLAP